MNNVCTEQMRSFSQCICCNVHVWDNAERCNIMEITSIFLYKPLQAKRIYHQDYTDVKEVWGVPHRCWVTRTHTHQISKIYLPLSLVRWTFSCCLFEELVIKTSKRRQKKKEKSCDIPWLWYNFSPCLHEWMVLMSDSSFMHADSSPFSHLHKGLCNWFPPCRGGLLERVDVHLNAPCIRDGCGIYWVMESGRLLGASPPPPGGISGASFVPPQFIGCYCLDVI